jgi:hypothetical protein
MNAYGAVDIYIHVKHYTMNAYGAVDVYIHVLLTSALVGEA